jgi:hypothetical protein
MSFNLFERIINAIRPGRESAQQSDTSEPWPPELQILHIPLQKIIRKPLKPLKNHLQNFRRPSIRHTRINARINMKLNPDGPHKLSV